MRHPTIIVNAVSDRIRRGLIVLAVALAGSVVVAADDSLARAVPADVGLFLELRKADDLLVPLVEPQVWLTLADLAGQPAALRETEQWEQRIRQTVNMSSREAIRTLFSQRVAFVAEGLRSTQESVILCRPAIDARQLLKRWPAQPLPTAGQTSVYRLPNNVSLGLRNELLIFGDQAARSLFDRVLKQSEPKAPVALADDPTFQYLLARVPADPDGVFLLRLANPPGAATPTTTASAPAAVSRPASPQRVPELPALLRDSSNVLFALHREGQLLHISAVGDAPGTTTPPDGLLDELVGTLPQQTLAVWAGHVDYPRLARLAAALPERNVFRVAEQIHERAGTLQRLTDALHPATCLALGTVMPEARTLPAPPIPAVAILVTSRDGATVAAEWADIFHATLALYKLLSLKLAQPPPLPPLEALTVAGVDAEQLDLSGLLGPVPQETPIGELHLSWARDGNVLIIASHTEWLRQVLEARHGNGPRLATVLDMSRRPASPHRDTIFVAQTGPLADLGSFWLHYFERFRPQVLDEDWWRDYQPGGANIRLGAQVTQDPEGRRLIVQSITPGSPTDGILKVDDEIIGCNRRRFATSQPVEEIVRGVARRPNARWVDLLIERERVVRVKRVPLPFVDPIELLRRSTAIGRVLQRVVYVDDAPDAEGPRGYLTLELRTDQKPLYEFPTSAPSTATAAPPAPLPPAPPAAETQPAPPPVSAPAPVAKPEPAPASAPAPPVESAPVAPTTQPAVISEPAPESQPPTTAPAE